MMNLVKLAYFNFTIDSSKWIINHYQNLLRGMRPIEEDWPSWKKNDMRYSEGEVNQEITIHKKQVEKYKRAHDELLEELIYKHLQLEPLMRGSLCAMS